MNAPATQPVSRTLASHGSGEWEDELVVTARRVVATDVVLLELRHADGAALPTWTPGAHIDLLLPGDMVRQYSLTGDPTDATRWLVAILKEDGRGGSRWVHDSLDEGHRIRVRGPRNHFPLAEGDRYHFVAGGIGITPIAAMARQAEARGAQWRLTYCGRDRAGMALVDEVLAFGGDRVELRISGEGTRADLRTLVQEITEGARLYACGPARLLEGLESACAAAGRPAPRVEHFTPKEFDTSSDEAFEVEVASTGQVLQVPADRSILEVLRDAGIPTVASCEEGTCGTCETGILEGVPEHRDNVLTPEEQAENDFMMVCVSRCRSERLVLDV